MKTVELLGGVKLELCWIPPCEFQMGDANSDEDDEKPVHRVKITRGFWLGKYPVTQEQYETVTEKSSEFKGDRNPVEQVSWDDAQEFCRQAEEQVGVALRLPTEGGMEYACRAGTKTTYYSGNQETDLARSGWYETNSGEKTQPVGRKYPTLGVCTTCMATSMNGARIGMMRTTMTAVRARSARPRFWRQTCVAGRVVGRAIPTAVALPAASGTIPTTGKTPSGFGCA